MTSVKCPQCERIVPIRTSRFGDAIYARHNMARINDPDAIPEHGFNNPINPEATPIWLMPCPMSGQPVEEENE